MSSGLSNDPLIRVAGSTAGRPAVRAHAVARVFGVGAVDAMAVMSVAVRQSPSQAPLAAGHN